MRTNGTRRATNGRQPAGYSPPMRRLSLACLLLALVPALPAAAAPTWQALVRAAPGLDPAVARMAMGARDCAVRHGAPVPKRLAIIDYSRPSTRPRLWVFDLARPRLLHVEHVAHGRGTGENHSRHFSNVDGSHQSSLGLFITGETYIGENGYSLRMDGLEPGINDRARERLLVMHGADYVDPAEALRQGRLGRSWGCPAVRRAVAAPVIDALKDGQMLFAYYPQRAWLVHSALLHCRPSAAAGVRRGRAAFIASRPSRTR